MQRLTIGRTPNCDIFFNDQSVSRLHAEIIVNNEEVTIKDLDSANGTFINGIKIYGTQHLKQYDILKVGNSLVPWKNYVNANAGSGSNESYQPTTSNSNQLINLENTKVPTVGDWMLNLFLTAIPLVGLIMIIVWANQDDIVMKNYAKAKLWWMLIAFCLGIIIFLIITMFYGSLLNSVSRNYY